MPITNEVYPALLALIGKPQSRRSHAGVYIFSHKSTGKKYVGSSNNLSRRLKQYFEKNILFSNKDTGLLTPLINKEGFNKFTLEIIIIPTSYSKYSHCFLEQYFLLDKRFDLNTHKIVNFRVNQGYKIYLYDITCNILYYTSNSLNAFCEDLGIHHSSYKKCISTGKPYLSSFIISNTLITKATPTKLTELEVRELINKSREESLNELHKSYGKAVEVFDTKSNKKETYDSVSKVANKFGIGRSTVRRHIVNGKPYNNNYYFKFMES